LVKDHKAGNAKSLQKSGTEEDMTEFIESLDELVDLATTTSRDVEKKAAARAKQKKLDDDGKDIREAAFTDSESQPRRKRPKADADHVLASMNDQIQHLDEEKLRLDQTEQKRHEEMMGALFGMKNEMATGRVQAKRQHEAQRARDCALREDLQRLGTLVSTERQDAEPDGWWDEEGDIFD
jgi:hypothetical protein